MGRGSSGAGASNAKAKGGGSTPSLSQATSEQNRIMNNMKKALSKRSIATAPQFEMQADGDVAYKYSMVRKVEHVHDSKMQSPEKNDIYERTETYTGIIRPDGLRLKNKTTTNDILIKKGKRK